MPDQKPTLEYASPEQQRRPEQQLDRQRLSVDVLGHHLADGDSHSGNARRAGVERRLLDSAVMPSFQLFLKEVTRPTASGSTMPHTIAPMLAVSSDTLPRDSSQWAFEFKWDGVGAVCFWDGKRLSLQSRNKLDITRRYPELQGLVKRLPRLASDRASTGL
ncbi:MAG TPA: hypothetical protein VK797_02015 [Tepidisphaeraceae bacterium]|jgi:hypothetical protein|nr:hypothetical protein [Tepidisphaeraceae bacterium]